MAAGGTWSDYTYDPPFETTLVNLPGIRDPRELALLEKFTVALRVRDLHAGDAVFPGYGDVESLRNLHLYLYQDVYPFAGEFRTVEVGVEHRDRVAPVAEIRPVLEAACGLANDPAWHRMDAEDFAWRAAEVHALLEYAHPFVIGNGVTSREFLADVASVGPFSLDVEAMGWPSGPLAVSSVTRDPDGTYQAYPGPGVALAIHRSLSVDVEALRAERDHAELAPSREVLAAVGDPDGAGVRGSAGGGGPVVARPGLDQAGPHPDGARPMNAPIPPNAGNAVNVVIGSNHNNHDVAILGDGVVGAESVWDNLGAGEGPWWGGVGALSGLERVKRSRNGTNFGRDYGVVGKGEQTYGPTSGSEGRSAGLRPGGPVGRTGGGSG